MCVLPLLIDIIISRTFKAFTDEGAICSPFDFIHTFRIVQSLVEGTISGHSLPAASDGRAWLGVAIG